MKKILFATLMVGSVSAVFSQGNIKKGDWMLGGSAGFNYSKYAGYKTNTFSLSPDAGYFFINNFAGGLRINLTSEKSKSGSSSDVTSSSYEIAPFVRYYFLPSAQKVNIFADGSFGFGQNKETGSITDYKYNFTGYGIEAGPAIFLTPATALEIALGYTSRKVKDASDRTNNLGVNIGFQIHLPGTVKK